MAHDLKNSSGLRPFHSWQDAHQNFRQITQVPEDWFVSGSTLYMSVLGGLFPVYSFTFFILFGFGEEAIREYLRLGKLLAHHCKPFNFRGTSSEVVHMCEFSLGSKTLEVSDPVSGESGEEGRRETLLDIEDGYVARYKPKYRPDPHIPVSMEVIVI
ncbi:hypothetical protein QFC21_002104 [Naganishia friedmannii]|uniref:Uncharacterized protein n=1 Tax=Naganishia friedmannii TaxID=89922 RepID=A0ACC2W163_9TREE|nr:hypothetical protein QFC21_002104 [Naganishia friedmannii]